MRGARDGADRLRLPRLRLPGTSVVQSQDGKRVAGAGSRGEADRLRSNRNRRRYVISRERSRSTFGAHVRIPGDARRRKTCRRCATRTMSTTTLSSGTSQRRARRCAQRAGRNRRAGTSKLNLRPGLVEVRRHAARGRTHRPGGLSPVSPLPAFPRPWFRFAYGSRAAPGRDAWPSSSGSARPATCCTIPTSTPPSAWTSHSLVAGQPVRLYVRQAR